MIFEYGLLEAHRLCSNLGREAQLLPRILIPSLQVLPLLGGHFRDLIPADWYCASDCVLFGATKSHCRKLIGDLSSEINDQMSHQL